MLPGIIVGDDKYSDITWTGLTIAAYFSALM